MNTETLSGLVLDDAADLSVDELCSACCESTAWVIEMVEEGVLEPRGRDIEHWRFTATSLQRAYTAARLQRDLKVNLAGIALVLDLLDELNELRARDRRHRRRSDQRYS